MDRESIEVLKEYPLLLIIIHSQCPSRNEIVFSRSRKMRILTTGIH
jgi:hypothetical protein